MTQSFTTFHEFKRRYPIRPGDKGALLGSGSYGRVIKVEDQLETEWVAIKISEFKGNDGKSLKAEVELAKKVPRQANIARYDACYRLETDASVSDFAIMKYYPDGNLADLLQREKLTTTQIYDLTRGILLGLQHLHRHHIVHRDFKPANILISRDYAGRLIPKIADFGLSKLVNDDEIESSDFDLSDGRGTPSYKAPEQIEGSRVSFNLDLWAFGVILYEMLTGEKPFRADLRNYTEQSARREIERRIMSVELPEQIHQITEPYRTMIRRCLVRDIHERVRKEDELLDLLDGIPQLMAEAQQQFDRQHYQEALNLFEQVIAKREQNVLAQKNAIECRKLIGRQLVNRFLEEADRLTAQHQFEEAKRKYEQILEHEPSQEEAIRGLAFCSDQQQPKILIADSDLTDVYAEERTDIYFEIAEFIPFESAQQEITAPNLVPAEPNPLVQLSESKHKIVPVTSSSVDNSIKTFPWHLAVPVALVIGGMGVYLSLRGPTSTQSDQQKGQIQSVAIGSLSMDKQESSVIEPKLKPIEGETKEALTKRIDIALGKAKHAFEEKNYSQVEVLTHSALLLDPSRQDVAALRNAALKESKEANPANQLTEPVSITPVSPKEEATPVDLEKTKAPEAVPSPADAKQEAQGNYDELIEEGVRAISNGNNKAKAIATFIKANGLAKEFGLNTYEGTMAYNEYLGKANRLFENEAYEGAKAWYLVAQSLKDTDEVRRKIKQCTDQ